ncbi:head GIN domain-containing protein [Maribacter thermophilus]|uniref:head GIN domain-containing protein n=1 Tax=Maribacter thermophilus TaxID=1197874 RepID=UPI0006417D17|nr:head GIN domain-containing protein [Maribacter thermophilus]
MTTLIRITIALFLALFLSSCGFDINFGDFGSGKTGNGTVVEETREVTDDFTTIHASEGLDVYVTQDDNFSITVEADENIIDLIGTDIENGKLKIHAVENIGRATKKVFVSLPDVKSLKSSSGAHLTTQNMVKGDDINIDSSSGSILNLEVTADQIDIDASSGANIEIAGKAREVYVDGSSGANINAKNLLSKECRAEGSSGANINVNVSDLLTADASSGANISYSGGATVKKNKSVSGSVHKY